MRWPGGYAPADPQEQTRPQPGEAGLRFSRLGPASYLSVVFAAVALRAVQTVASSELLVEPKAIANLRLRPEIYRAAGIRTFECVSQAVGARKIETLASQKRRELGEVDVTPDRRLRILGLLEQGMIYVAHAHRESSKSA